MLAGWALRARPAGIGPGGRVTRSCARGSETWLIAALASAIDVSGSSFAGKAIGSTTNGSCGSTGSEGLVLPRKRPKKRLWQRPKPLLPAVRPNERWSMDFVQDRLQSGTALPDPDDRRRLHAGVESRGRRHLDRRRPCRPACSRSFEKPQGYPPPSSRTTDRNSRAGPSCRGPSAGGSICASSSRESPLKTPSSRASTGSFGRSASTRTGLRRSTMPGATIETWRADYNDVRPHSSLDDRTPAEFAAAHRETAA